MDLSKATTERQIDITAKLDINTTEELVVTYGYDKEADNLLTEEEKSHLLTAGFEYAQSVKIPVGEKYAENYLTLKPSEMQDGKWILPVRVGTTNDKVGSDAAPIGSFSAGRIVVAISGYVLFWLAKINKSVEKDYICSRKSEY